MSREAPGVLVLCTGNSCRSQMAEAFLRHYAEGRLRVFSATGVGSVVLRIDVSGVGIQPELLG